MAILLILWCALLVLLVAFAVGRPREGGALTLSYFLGLSLIHVPGALIYADQSGLVFNNKDWTLAGFRMTVLGLAAFVAGAVALKTMLPAQKNQPVITRTRAQELTSVGWRFAVAGVIVYFVLIPVSFAVPSLTAVVAPLATLIIVGLWLRLYGATILHNRVVVLRTLVLLPLLPVSTVLGGGFIGFGTYWALSVVAFLFVVLPRRMPYYLGAPVVVYLGLSVFVTYMAHRNDIRDVVQRERAPIVTRIESAATLVTDFQLFDLGDTRHRIQIDRRLNQNFLVGAGIRRHQDGLVGLEYGSTVPLWVVVPRAIWPDKPIVGGGGDLVTAFTGIRFAVGTSVGVGQVLEFYMNFGTIGVILGFFGLGFLLMSLDRGIMRGMTEGNLDRVLKCALPGLALIQPGGNLLEILLSAVAAVVVYYLILRFRSVHRFLGVSLSPTRHLVAPAQGFVPPR